MDRAHNRKETMRRLTDLQTAVLAAVERLDNPTLPEVAAQFPGRSSSDVFRVMEGLGRRGLVAMSGNPHYLYVGDGYFAPPDDAPAGEMPLAMDVPPDEVCRFHALPLALRDQVSALLR